MQSRTKVLPYAIFRASSAPSKPERRRYSGHHHVDSTLDKLFKHCNKAIDVLRRDLQQRQRRRRAMLAV